jgi:hypothetical protein
MARAKKAERSAISVAAAILGRKGGRVRSPARTEAARRAIRIRWARAKAKQRAKAK